MNDKFKLTEETIELPTEHSIGLKHSKILVAFIKVIKVGL